MLMSLPGLMQMRREVKKTPLQILQHCERSVACGQQVQKATVVLETNRDSAEGDNAIRCMIVKLNQRCSHAMCGSGRRATLVFLPGMPR